MSNLYKLAEKTFYKFLNKDKPTSKPMEESKGPAHYTSDEDKALDKMIAEKEDDIDSNEEMFFEPEIDSRKKTTEMPDSHISDRMRIHNYYGKN